MQHIAIILNPQAGDQQLAQKIDRYVDHLQQHFATVHLYQTKKRGDGAQYIRRYGAELDLIIAAGGDGTVYECINALCELQKKPAFSIIPGGTCNDFSRTIGLDQNPAHAVEQICRQNVATIDVGKTTRQFFLNFWGIGLITQVSANIDSKIKAKYGRLAYYLSTLQNVNKATPFQLTLEADGKTIHEEAIMLIVGNGAFTGGLQAFFPHKNVQDNLFDVLVIKKTSLESLWTLIESKFKDEVQNNESMTYLQARHLRVYPSPSQKIDCDGERHFMTPEEMKVLPGYIKMIVGDM